MIQLFNTFLVNPIINLIVVIYQLLNGLHIPYALGFSIIILTILIRFLLYPLTATQLRASKKMQEITPHLSKLKEKHKRDAKRLQEETMLLYRQHGVNPVAGCLPVLIQLPVIWALYSVLQTIVKLDSQHAISEINKQIYPFLHGMQLSKHIDLTFFAIPLGQSPSHLLAKVGILIFFIPALTGIFQYIQSKMMFSQTPKQPSQSNQKKNEKKKDEPDFATAFQTQSLYLFPIMIGYFSFSFPVGLSLYWNTFTIFGIIQQYKIQQQKKATNATFIEKKKQQ